MLTRPPTYIKAIVGALVAGLGALSVAIADGTITGGEWTGIALSTVVAFGGVFGIPNAESGD